MSQAVAAIKAAVDAGVTLIDTAPIYGFGRSEQLVGEAIEHRRDELVLATKCGNVWDRQKGTFRFYSSGLDASDKPARIKSYSYLGPESIRDELENSLKRLRTDRIDLYQVHLPDETTPIAETMAELMKLKAAGKILAIGVSNMTVSQLDEYRAAGALDADQEKYNMLDRDHERDLLPYCAEHSMAMLAYSPLCFGLLTGKIAPGRTYGPGDLRGKSARFADDNLRKVAAMLDEFKPIAERHGISLGQLAIAWTAAQPGVTHVLCGARKVRHAIENAAAGDITLTDEDIKTISDAIAKHAPSLAPGYTPTRRDS